MKRWVIRTLVSLCLLTFVGVVALAILTLYSPAPNLGDCREHPPFVRQYYSDQAVFVTKILYTSGDWHPDDERMPWSIGLVEHRYWGLPWWASKIVLIGHGRGSFKKGQEYFIDGDRGRARISPFVPYIDFTCSNRTKPLSDAGVEIRLLRDGPPKSGVRIIGRTIRRFGVGDWRAAPAVTVRITGPGGTLTEITDEHGIYDAMGLPPGHYSVRADPEDDADTFPREYYERVEGELKAGDVWGRDILVK